MMKRIVLWLFTLILLLPATHSFAATTFSDVPSNYWAKEEIDYLVAQKIIQGKGGKFRPNDALKRMQAAEMLVKALGLSTANRPDPNFKDLKRGDYGYEYAATLADEGIMTGSNGYFKPWDTLTRGQMAKILAEAFRLGYVFDSNFKDVAPTDWTYHYVTSLVGNHITTGYPDNTYRPNAKLTRAQFSAFMARTLNDEFKRAVLWNIVDYEWDKQGGLTLLVEVKNNFLNTVEVSQADLALVMNNDIIADGMFTFEVNELRLAPKQTEQIVLSFDPTLVYIEPTDLTNVEVYSQTTLR
jgi:hypothetical protein